MQSRVICWKSNRRRTTSNGLHGVIHPLQNVEWLQITRTISADTYLVEGRTSKTLCALKFVSIRLLCGLIFKIYCHAYTGIPTATLLSMVKNHYSTYEVLFYGAHERITGLLIVIITPWLESSANELYLLSDHQLSAKLVPTFADIGCRAVSSADPYGRNIRFLDRSRYFFYQVAPELYSRD
jgi:hypothetical protein